MSLTPKQQRVVSGQLEALTKSSAKEADFGNKKQQSEAERIRNALLDQKGYHRSKLLKFIMRMTVASFVLLAFIVTYQMIVRLWIDRYVGVSDGVIEVLAVTVFGQIIGIVASIALAVWKDSN